jgi:hypothetical protein
MSEIKVNKITPRTACGTTQLGDSGDTFTIPSGVTISNSGTAAGFGGTGEISWDTTVKTTGTFTATSGVGYFLNTTGGTITVNLPAGAAGSSVAFADYAGTWQTSSVTVAANGTEKIGGVDADVNLTTEGQSVQFVYIDSTQGWVNVIDSTSNVRGNAFVTATGGTITTCGDYKIHTFLSPATFTVTNAGTPAGSNTVDYLVVAGGGGGGASTCGYDGGAGGGAGGFRLANSTSMPAPLTSPLATPTGLAVPAQPYPITVGGGGAGGPDSPTDLDGTPGDNSVFSTIASAGGGGGGGQVPNRCGLAGGSGGGYGGGGTAQPGAAGNTPPVSPPQGQPGGPGGGAPVNYYGGGGGGAGGAGAKGESPNTGGPGGVGSYVVAGTAFAGCHGDTGPVPGTKYFAGGGGGGGAPQRPVTGGGTGGDGGGGNGHPATAGACNTGGGGGGGDNSSGGNGGSGIVIIRYKYQ